MDTTNKIYLSPPCITNKEIKFVNEALLSGWISPYGSFINNFTKKLSLYYSHKNILLTNNGTSAIHLALKILNIKEGDYVLCSDFTFAATAFPILYQKAIPVFIGADQKSWNLSPEYLEHALIKLKNKNIHPKVLIVAHIYGMPCNMKSIFDICKNYNIKIIEDAAEALGSKYNNLPLGQLGDYGILSFNGNKIITCSTGGALILPNQKNYSYAKKLANQAKENIDYYKHEELGYNYSQSNILAAIGLAQFKSLNQKVTQRRNIFNYYLSYFKNKLEIEFQIEEENCFSNRWLSSFIFPKDLNKKIKDILNINGIESRYLWNPLYKQPVFKNYFFYGDKSFENYLFRHGLSLPSGNNLTKNKLKRIINIIDKNL